MIVFVPVLPGQRPVRSRKTGKYDRRAVLLGFESLEAAHRVAGGIGIVLQAEVEPAAEQRWDAPVLLGESHRDYRVERGSYIPARRNERRHLFAVVTARGFFGVTSLSGPIPSRRVRRPRGPGRR